MEKKRTIKLTEEQFNLVKHALGIAESQFVDLHKEITHKTILVRALDSQTKKEEERIVEFYHAKACEFADLNVALTNGNLDV
jgi:hypothetical protein